jgi:hypothetical protein
LDARGSAARVLLDGTALQRTRVKHEEIAGGERHHRLEFFVAPRPPVPPLGREKGPWP